MSTRRTRHTIGRAVSVLREIADPSLAQEWDNVGLIAGDPRAACKGIALCIDMTSDVIDEAVGVGANLIVAYHPPIFRAVKRLVADSRETDSLVLRALHRGLHIYAMHTALDAADGGTNDVIAALCGIKKVDAFEDVPAESARAKVVVFVPADEVDTVAQAMFDAGAGCIGDYEKCSYRLGGTGTFFGTEGTDPTIGRRGRFETVDEIRLESVVDVAALPAVLAAARRVHSYEEPAIDVYPLSPSRMRFGIGRVGDLPRKMTLGGLAGRLKKAVGAPAVSIVGDRATPVRRVAICVGSAGRLPDQSPRLRDCDVLVTGEISHHDALYWQRRTTPSDSPFGAIALGHWHSERPVLRSVADRLGADLPGLPIKISHKDRDPFASM